MTEGEILKRLAHLKHSEILPVRSDTLSWQLQAKSARAMILIKERLSFNGHGNTAREPSCIFILNSNDILSIEDWEVCRTIGSVWITR